VNEVIKKIKKDSNLALIGPDSRIFYDKDLDKLIVDQSDEGMTESIANDWKVFCRDNDIPINKILVLNNNPMVEREFLYSYDYYFMECKRVLRFGKYAFGKKQYSNYQDINYDIKKEKIYNCLNNNIRAHRTFIFDGLKERKLLRYGFVSYRKEDVFLPKDKDITIPNWRWDTLIPDMVSKTYFNVVTECGLQPKSQSNPLGSDGCFITEKTCKALITQPFMVVGNYEILKYLKEGGFETYPELFDESYDLIENPQDRFNLILDEIERLCNMDKTELEEIYKSVLWKVEHNRKRMLHLEDDEFAVKYLSHWRV
jgi:hypothetical protein